jgi:(2R)-3-sulfolactate dehydrogenase (NADP+)
MLAPLGGAKGYALALLVESLTGVLVGPLLARDIPDMFDPDVAAQPQKISHFVMAIDVAAFDTDASSRLVALSDAVIETGGRLPGSNRLQPSSIPADLALTIAPAVIDQLQVWSEKLAIA